MKAIVDAPGYIRAARLHLVASAFFPMVVGLCALMATKVLSLWWGLPLLVVYLIAHGINGVIYNAWVFGLHYEGGYDIQPITGPMMQKAYDNYCHFRKYERAEKEKKKKEKEEES
jgi:hypothetical protein